MDGSQACEGMDVQLFFEDYEESSAVAESVDEICLGCPLIQECLRFGVSTDSWGVFGGYYLIDGRINRSANSHKTKETWKQLEAKHLGLR